MKRFSLIWILLLALQGAAQSPSWERPLKPVSSTGWYIIPFTPEMYGRSDVEVRDVRIRDEKGQQVAYLVQPSVPAYSKRINWFPVMNLEHDSISESTIFQAPALIDHLLLMINNNDVERKADLSGSDDGVRWYILKEDLQLMGSSEAEPGQKMAIVGIPASGYKYLKLRVYHEHKDPLQIIKVGTSEQISNAPVRDTLTLPLVSGKHEGKVSYYDFHLDYPVWVFCFRLLTADARLYSRQVSLGFWDKGAYRERFGSMLKSTGNEFMLDHPVGVHDFVVRVMNQDDSPLNVRAVELLLPKVNLIANLQAAKKYTVSGGDSTLSEPVYDLEYFRDQIKSDSLTKTQVTYADDIRLNPNVSPGVMQTSKVWIWTALILGVLTTLLLIRRMMRSV